MPTIEIDTKQLKNAIEQLNDKEKAKLVEELEKETLRLRWRQILKDIDSRLKKFPISKDKVAKEIGAYRKEKHAQGRH